MMLDRILIPLDGSRRAEAALGFAELLPSKQVCLLQVEPAVGGSGSDHAASWERWRTDRTTEGARYLEEAGERLRRQGRVVEAVVAFGDPAECIISMAADADLIIMTTHGRGGAERVLLGSVADRVARHGPCPTLLIRSTTPVPAPPCVARIVVPLDGSAVSTSALPWAAVLARELGVPIHLVQVLDVASPGAALRAGPAAAQAHRQTWEVARHDAEASLDVIVRQLRNQDLRASKEVLAGNPPATLLRTVAATDLVVMTTHGYSGVRRLLLGSVADMLVREANAPVLLVRASSPATEPLAGATAVSR